MISYILVGFQAFFDNRIDSLLKDYQIQFNMNMHPIISQILLSSIKKKQKEYIEEEPIVTIEKIRKLTKQKK